MAEKKAAAKKAAKVPTEKKAAEKSLSKAEIIKLIDTRIAAALSEQYDMSLAEGFRDRNLDPSKAVPLSEIPGEHR